MNKSSNNNNNFFYLFIKAYSKTDCVIPSVLDNKINK